MENETSFRAKVNKNPRGNLLKHEEWWRDHQVFLESRGYMLRPRLRPGWKPSWLGTGRDPWTCFTIEDAVYSDVRMKLMDATHMSDGKMVYIKQVVTGDQESTIACYFSSDAMRQHPDNHSVPILDLFPDGDDPSISFMVMPYLREFYSPSFEYVGEVLDFGEQVLKRLTFMHEQGVAHRQGQRFRDCAQMNIMVDAPGMYPRGYHPVRSWLLPDLSAFSPYKPRLTVDVKYYFVDYGISTQFPPGTTSGMVLGTWAQDHDVPELSDEVAYDAFKVDIFTLGNVFRRVICDKYVNAEFIRPLAAFMTNADPSVRPTAAQALAEWRAVCASFSTIGRYRRLRAQEDPEEFYVERPLWQVYYTLRAGIHLLM
ncbi:hypothetical protein OF83DRAFT_1060482 [Amylostereum chailletii]|nr:hypothetical protein OF83DRAFT_1060482 [Amylostereum chailletii]